MKKYFSKILKTGFVLAQITVITLTIGCENNTPQATPQKSNPPTQPSQIPKIDQMKGELPMKIESTAFAANQPIPKKFTGEGDDISPPLTFTNLPEGTGELALICDDPDAPTPEPWVHWVIYKIPATTTALGQAMAPTPQMSEPAGALQGLNSWPSNNIGYRGPMPPPGHGVHHYHFKLFALDQPLDLKPGLSKNQLLAAMKNHILAQAELIGTYKR
ncbi:MAG: YbhB/YbcL family Raf kinase inhibitor-like protein [Sedimentisphaerales bacterium]|nr:YbhB/YbcL family Raf kinase inhibitor-like protein [Sedimentisphaerales bacterium]